MDFQLCCSNNVTFGVTLDNHLTWQARQIEVRRRKCIQIMSKSGNVVLSSRNVEKCLLLGQSSRCLSVGTCTRNAVQSLCIYGQFQQIESIVTCYQNYLWKWSEQWPSMLCKSRNLNSYFSSFSPRAPLDLPHWSHDWHSSWMPICWERAIIMQISLETHFQQAHVTASKISWMHKTHICTRKWIEK